MAIKISVSAGNHNRFACPVSVLLEQQIPFANGRLVAPSGKTVPVQISPEGSGVRLTWILDYLLKGENLDYLLEIGDNEVPCRCENTGEIVDIYLANRLYTSYYFGSKTAKPYLGPFKGMNGEQITRLNFEETEHPHHRSVWFSHGSVNGVDTWNESPGIHGFILNRGIRDIENGSVMTGFTSTNTWTDHGKKPLLEDETKLVFYAGPENVRVIDAELKLIAKYGSVVLGRTKEAGPIAVRMNYNLTVEKTGTMINGYGAVNEEEIWMKRSPWCDYYGQEDGRTYGVAIMDNPDNIGYPSYWHARDYGLMAPNNFHVPGDMTIAEGDSVTYKFRLVFHAGDTATAGISGKFHDYISPPLVTVV
jgi:hypothetical protein